MNKAILDTLICPICLDYSINPVNSTCCQAVYCKKCTETFHNCPICRVKCKFIESVLADRLIKMIETNCDQCGYKCTRGDIDEHKLKCDQIIIDCQINSCNKQIKKCDYLNHLIAIHSKEMNDKLSSIIEIFGSSNGCSNNSNQNEMAIEEKINKFKSKAKLGTTGKYYCGKRLDGPRCRCCNGYCGTHSGCNCSACMELDIKSRNLPNGWLINSDGFAARKSDGKFYCGRLVLEDTVYCDGYCGPTNGPQCEPCDNLNIMTRAGGRYSDLIKN